MATWQDRSHYLFLLLGLRRRSDGAADVPEAFEVSRDAGFELAGVEEPSPWFFWRDPGDLPPLDRVGDEADRMRAGGWSTDSDLETVIQRAAARGDDIGVERAKKILRQIESEAAADAEERVDDADRAEREEHASRRFAYELGDNDDVDDEAGSNSPRDWDGEVFEQEVARAQELSEESQAESPCELDSGADHTASIFSEYIRADPLRLPPLLMGIARKEADCITRHLNIAGSIHTQVTTILATAFVTEWMYYAIDHEGDWSPVVLSYAKAAEVAFVGALRSVAGNALAASGISEKACMGDIVLWLTAGWLLTRGGLECLPVQELNAAQNSSRLGKRMQAKTPFQFLRHDSIQDFPPGSSRSRIAQGFVDRIARSARCLHWPGGIAEVIITFDAFRHHFRNGPAHRLVLTKEDCRDARNWLLGDFQPYLSGELPLFSLYRSLLGLIAGLGASPSSIPDPFPWPNPEGLRARLSAAEVAGDSDPEGGRAGRGLRAKPDLESWDLPF